jgi:hypothetical protein
VAVELLNQTLAAARLFTGFTDPTSGVAALVARRTYRLDDAGALAASDAPWPIFAEPLQTDVGVFPSDMTPAHAGCDLVIAGVARAAEPVTSLAVSAAVGAFATHLVLVGPRVWEERDGELVPSAPAPFTEMPLGWAAAYGGVSDYEGMPAPYPFNAEGKGFYLQREEAKGRPLPNLEWPHAPIRAWNERPLPACWGPVADPLTWHLAKAALAAQQSDEAMERLEERVFISACQPDLIMPPLVGGEDVVLTGLDAQPTRFRLPAAGPRVRAEIGADVVEAQLVMSSVWILLSQRLVVVTWRGGFAYPFRQHDKRRATLLDT